MKHTEPVPTFTPGIYDGVPFAIYQNARGVTHHDLSRIRRPPARRETSLTPPSEDNKFAALLRLAIFHPDAFENAISHSLRSKADFHPGGRHEASEELPASVPFLTKDEQANVLTARAAVRAHPAARSLLTAGGESGVSIFGCHPETGLTLRARLDRLVEDAQGRPWIIEIMPCADVARFAQSARESRADLQSVFTTDVLALAGLPDAVFVFIAVEAPSRQETSGVPAAPSVASVPCVPAVRVITLDTPTLENARAEYERELTRLAESKAAGRDAANPEEIECIAV